MRLDWAYLKNLGYFFRFKVCNLSYISKGPFAINITYHGLQWLGCGHLGRAFLPTLGLRYLLDIQGEMLISQWHA